MDAGGWHGWDTLSALVVDVLDEAANKSEIGSF